MPEFYGWIENIRQMDITIDTIYIDPYRQYQTRFSENIRKHSEWSDKLVEYFRNMREWQKTRRGLEPKMPQRDPSIDVESKCLEFEAERYHGPKMTLSVVGEDLIDKAISAKGSMCRFKVEKGKIMEIRTWVEFCDEIEANERSQAPVK